jgi:hypothetical protein
MPTLKIELDGVRQNMTAAFMDSMDEIKEYTKLCIDNAMNPLLMDRLEVIIQQVATDAVENAIKEVITEVVREEISEYFWTDKGKEVILKAVREGISIGSG